MRQIRPLFALGFVCTLACGTAIAAPLTKDQVRNDVDVLQQAITALHPGLNRYLAPADVGAMFEGLRHSLATAPDRRAQFLAVSEALSRIKCANTSCNFWKQSDAVKAELFEGRRCVPFAFRFIGGHMIVTRDATSAQAIPVGSVIRAINGVKVDEIVARLMALVPADGANDPARLKALEVTANGDYEAFDLYLRAAYDIGEKVLVAYIAPNGAKTREFEAPCMTRTERRDRILARYPDDRNQPPVTFEVLSGSVGYLRVATFDVAQLGNDWNDTLRKSFGTMKKNGIAELVVDLRGNGGGDAAVADQLLRHLVSAPIGVPAARALLRYDVVPENLPRYLSAPNKAFLDRRDNVTFAGAGFYAWNGGAGPSAFAPEKDAYLGNVHVLIDEKVAGEAFRVAQALGADPRTTLVGRTTGGNLKGTNGRDIVTLQLPGAGLAVEIPLVGYFPEGDPPDAGLAPDVTVTPTMDGITGKHDEDLNAALVLIGK